MNHREERQADQGQLQGSDDGFVAQVYCDGMSMNAEMIFNNYAMVDLGIVMRVSLHLSCGLVDVNE